MQAMRDRATPRWLQSRAGWKVPIAALGVLYAVAAITSTARVDELIKAAMSLDASPKRGATLYYDQCQGCHGVHAEGDARNLVPSLAGQRQLYLVKQLADFVELERESPEMHRKVAVAGLDAPQAIIDVAGYLNAQPVLKQPQAGDGSLTKLGEGMFREQCASCHGDDARGDEDGSVPSLRNQHYSYLLQQMRKIGAGHRADIDPDLARFLESLDGEELAGVADYLSRLRGPVPDRRHMRPDGTVVD
jgi:cytochrome c553